MFRIKGFKSFPLKTLSDRKIYRGGKNEKDIFWFNDVRSFPFFNLPIEW